MNQCTWAAIKDAFKNNCLYVYAKDSKLKEWRITSAKTKHGLLYGHALATGKWFVIHSWEQR